MQDLYLNSNYRIYKDIFSFEDHLIQLPDDNLRVVLTKFRCRNNKMPVEIGVRNNVQRIQNYYMYVYTLNFIVMFIKLFDSIVSWTSVCSLRAQYWLYQTQCCHISAIDKRQ